MSDKKLIRDLLENAEDLGLKKHSDYVAMINEVVKVSVENDLVVEFKHINYDSVIVRDEGYVEIWIQRKNGHPSDCYHLPLTNKNAEYLKTGLRKAKLKELNE